MGVMEAKKNALGGRDRVRSGGLDSCNFSGMTGRRMLELDYDGLRSEKKVDPVGVWTIPLRI